MESLEYENYPMSEFNNYFTIIENKDFGDLGMQNKAMPPIKRERELSKPLDGNVVAVPVSNVNRRKRRSESPDTYVPVLSDNEQTEESSQEQKPKKKPAKKAKKKQLPKRKRVNYCFEIHRSGCPDNKNSKLYCKVFLKGKLQAEVDLIKGARGKWAYTFYDQRKEKNERRYWPSQSSGPVIEDPCNCEKCQSTIRESNEADLSNSTEELTLVEPETMQPKRRHQRKQKPKLESSPYQEGAVNSNMYDTSEQQQQHHQQQIIYQVPHHQQQYPPMTVTSMSSNEKGGLDFQNGFNEMLSVNEMPQGGYLTQPQSEYPRANFMLKSSTEYHDYRAPYEIQQGNNSLKASMEFQMGQKNWGDFLPNNNTYEYVNAEGEGLFERDFLN